MSDQSSTDYQVGQDNITPFGLDIHNPVFLISGLSIVAFVLLTLLFQTEAAVFFAWLRPAITSNFDWFFLSAGNVFLVFALALCVSPYGQIRLGGKTPKPISAIWVGLLCYLQRAWV
jgi:BCCT family betaine/carnitine transporter